MIINIRFAASLFVFALLAASAQAEETRLEGPTLVELLTGNTVYGVHYGKKTVQYFSKSGLTLWMKEGDALPSEGKWKIQDHQYCSNFGSGWNCYRILLDKEQTIYYFTADNFRAPFVPSPGYHFEL